MKKKLANYLAFWSNISIPSFWVHLLLLGVTAIAITVIAKVTGSYDVVGVKIFLYFIYLLFIHGTFVGIASLFLISKKERGWQYWELIRVKDGRLFVLDDKAIPRTGYRYTIEKPSYGNNIREPLFKTWISVRSRNSKITIPVVIKFKVDPGFDVLELFSVLFNVQGPGPNFDFHKYVIRYFEKINESVMPQINELIRSYANSKISEPDLLNSVVDLLTFPERPFTGVKSTAISLDKPQIVVCKGQGCEN